METTYLADPLPVQRTSYAHVFIGIFLINYVWNSCLMVVVLWLLGVTIDRKFPIYTFILTIMGLLIDSMTILLLLGLGIDSKFGFLLLLLIAGLGLFMVAYYLTKLFFNTNGKSSAIVGLTYAIASNPVIGLIVLPSIVGTI